MALRYVYAKACHRSGTHLRDAALEIEHELAQAIELLKGFALLRLGPVRHAVDLVLQVLHLLHRIREKGDCRGSLIKAKLQGRNLQSGAALLFRSREREGSNGCRKKPEGWRGLHSLRA
jgi:hypothetical protein